VRGHDAPTAATVPLSTRHTRARARAPLSCARARTPLSCARARTMRGARAACLRSRVVRWSLPVCRRSGRGDASAHDHGGAHVRRAALRQVMAWVRVWVWVCTVSVLRGASALFAGRTRRGLYPSSPGVPLEYLLEYPAAEGFVRSFGGSFHPLGGPMRNPQDGRAGVGAYDSGTGGYARPHCVQCAPAMRQSAQPWGVQHAPYGRVLVSAMRRLRHGRLERVGCGS
jgi:hypothetical protein